MSLEERVRVVEQDVTAARAEARGWGEFAMQANNKVDGMSWPGLTPRDHEAETGFDTSQHVVV